MGYWYIRKELPNAVKVFDRRQYGARADAHCAQGFMGGIEHAKIVRYNYKDKPQ